MIEPCLSCVGPWVPSQHHKWDQKWYTISSFPGLTPLAANAVTENTECRKAASRPLTHLALSFSFQLCPQQSQQGCLCAAVLSMGTHGAPQRLQEGKNTDSQRVAVTELGNSDLPGTKPLENCFFLCENCVAFHMSVCFVPKAQFKKTDFVNSRTAKAYHSLKDWGGWKLNLRNFSLTILSCKKPQRKTPIFLLLSPRNLKKHAMFLSFSISMVPRMQKTNNQDIILLGFQKTFASAPPGNNGNRVHITLYKSRLCYPGLWCVAF